MKSTSTSLEEAIRLAPPTGHDEPAARAHYSLGIIMASSGRGADAIDHLSKAVAYDPTYPEAQLALGDALRRNGRAEASLPYSSPPRRTPARETVSGQVQVRSTEVQSKCVKSTFHLLCTLYFELKSSCSTLWNRCSPASRRTDNRPAVYARELKPRCTDTQIATSSSWICSLVASLQPAQVVEAGRFDPAQRIGTEKRLQ